jgi:hypothetical protein
MKNGFSVLLASIVVFSTLLSATGEVLAAPLGGGPVISAPSGGGSVTLTQIPVSKLPGSEVNDTGTIFPQGHLNGDMMFSGPGAKVSGLVGYATLSMPLSKYTLGWTGSIYQWLNETWVALPTSIQAAEEGTNGTASATISTDGIYALIVIYRGPYSYEKSLCPTDLGVLVAYRTGDGGFYITRLIVSGSDPESWLVVGRYVKFTIVNVSSESSFSGPREGRALITHSTPYGNYGYYIALALSDETYFYTYETPPTFTLRVNVNDCYVDADYPEDFIRVGGG